MPVEPGEHVGHLLSREDRNFGYFHLGRPDYGGNVAANYLDLHGPFERAM